MTESTTSTPVPAPSRLAALRRPAVLGAALVIAFLSWQWLETRWRMDDLQQELAKRLGDGDAVARDSRAVSQQNHSEIQTLVAKVGVLESKLAEAQGQREALENMYQELARGRDDRVLAEVEQSVALAAQQLQLAGNVEAALIALQSADARLSKTGSAQFLPVRRLLARDIEKLKALPLADVSGMAVKLEGVVVLIDSLPLAYTQRPLKQDASAKGDLAKADAKNEKPGFWAALISDFWLEMRQLVRVERMDQAAPALLAPSQSLFLRENLRLRLINARLALLQRDAKSFRDDLQQANQWLELYFDTRATPVQTARDTLQRLSGTNLNLELPSLTETLTSLRNIKFPREK
jgi:uroporphyrin-3 C-methyltransferase